MGEPAEGEVLMAGFRLDRGGVIDRSVNLGFTFDAKPFTGHPGDTLASALIASLVGKVESPVTLVPQSGLELTVHFGSGGGTFTEVYPQGDARAVSEGRILPDAWL